MNKNQAAVALGSIKSAKKAKSSRNNGSRGGRKESAALRESRQETFGLLMVIQDIRSALGDSEEKLMIGELAKHAMALREKAEREEKRANELDAVCLEIKQALDEMGAPIASAIGRRLLVRFGAR